MKALILPLTYIFILVFAFSVNAQWSSNPASPMVVCTAANTQNKVESFKDGTGGLYIFWRDARNATNNVDIYGQHYNAAGIAQWEAGGREIINSVGTIKSFSMVRKESGQMVIAWIVNQSPNIDDNGMFAQQINEDGTLGWDNDLRLKLSSGAYGDFAIGLVDSGDNFYVGMHYIVTGGTDKLKVNKFSQTGVLLGPEDGAIAMGMPITFGTFGITSDNNDGCYIYYSSANGGGATLHCMRMTGDTPTNSWPQWRNVTSGTQGLQGNFSAIGDPAGVTVVWNGNGVEGSGNNIYSRRLLASTGLLGWNETTKLISVANGNQTNFFWKKSGNEYYITWADGRPGVVGNYAIYAQKFNINGVLFWPENGLEVANLNTYIPYPEFDLDESNTMAVIHKSGQMQLATKVFTNGTLNWAPAGIGVMTASYAAPYEDYNVVYTGGKYIVIGTSSGGNIYMNQVLPPPVQVTETVTACNIYHFNNETYTESGTYIINLPGDTILTLNLTVTSVISEITQSGGTLISEYDGNFQWYNCDTQTNIDGATGPIFEPTDSGNYALIVTFNDCSDTSACENVVVLSTPENGNAHDLLLYPNPGNDLVTISSELLSSAAAYISIYNIQGKLMHTQRSCSSAPCEITTTDLKPGLYMIEINGDKGRVITKWLKQ
jgi:hypothetical protein